MLRTLASNDAPRLNELFALQGFAYDLPDVRQMAAAQAFEDEGRIEQAVLARPTVELYFLANPMWGTPLKRFHALQQLHESMRRELHATGFEDAHVFLPPAKARSFGRRLMQDFGWTRPLWTPLTRSTAPRGNF